MSNGNPSFRFPLNCNVDTVDRIDEGQAHLIQAFETGTGRDKNRCTIARELGIKSVGSL